MNAKIKLICPICRESLFCQDKSLICQKNHSFDFARQGYVNLLPVQNKHSLAPGDTKTMLSARRSFLNRGYYQPICKDVISMINKYSSEDYPVLADIGSGEGYYTVMFEKECSAECIGFDISKEASRMSCSRSKSVLWTVSTASHLPIESGSADIVTAVFSLFVNEEYARVLKSGGIFVEVTAGSEHLTELKRIIYDEVFEQDKHPSNFSESFEMLDIKNRSFQMELDNDALRELLLMTPHIHRIKKERGDILNNIESLKLTVNYIIRVLRKV